MLLTTTCVANMSVKMYYQNVACKNLPIHMLVLVDETLMSCIAK